MFINKEGKFYSSEMGVYDGEEFTKEEVIELLQVTILTIVFRKRDGSTRVMRATLQDSYLPNIAGKTKDHGRMVVWDVENDGWRTINT
jgi:hypothetical protein